MNIVDSHSGFLFLLVLVAYLPGLIAVLRSPNLAAMPVITFTFLGMFLFTVVGSWRVMTQSHPHMGANGEWILTAGTLASGAFVLMLLLQAFLFYAIVGPYVYLKSTLVKVQYSSTMADVFVRRALAIITVFILALYYFKVERFLLFDLLLGRINRINILDYRALTYGLKEYPFFRLGFLVFPSIIAALTIGLASTRGVIRRSDFFWIGVCLIPPLLLAEKAAILNMAAVIFIAYSLHLGANGRSLLSAFRIKTLLIIVAAFVPTLLSYAIYFSLPGDGIAKVADQFLFRIIGVYSESLAATVKFTEVHGFLSGTTMPNLKGLLSHERFDLGAAMHLFLGGPDVDPEAPIPGTIPVPVTGEGYVNFGWLGFTLFGAGSFLCVVLVQEVMLRLRLASTGFALSAWYGYLGFMLFTTSIFATFVSLVHTAVAASIIALWFIARWGFSGSLKWHRRLQP